MISIKQTNNLNGRVREK